MRQLAGSFVPRYIPGVGPCVVWLNADGEEQFLLFPDPPEDNPILTIVDEELVWADDEAGGPHTKRMAELTLSGDVGPLSSGSGTLAWGAGHAKSIGGLFDLGDDATIFTATAEGWHKTIGAVKQDDANAMVEYTIKKNGSLVVAEVSLIRLVSGFSPMGVMTRDVYLEIGDTLQIDYTVTAVDPVTILAAGTYFSILQTSGAIA